MQIKNCKYINNVDIDGKKIPNDPATIKTTLIDGKIWEVPLDPDNTVYAEILRLVDAGELTIEPAD